MVRIGPLQLTETWKYALVGGLLALPFSILQAWRATENVSLGMVVVGSVVAGYLIKRRGGNSTATGLRAALVGGVPAVWPLSELLWAVPTIPNPLWFRTLSIGLTLAAWGALLAFVALFGALSGRFGGWLAEQRGHGERGHGGVTGTGGRA